MERKPHKADGKRGIIIGFCAGILLVVFALSSAYAGCAGDCFTCHKKLKGNKNHLALGTCAKCHNPSTQKLLTLGSTSEGCGDNCFTCHKQWPKDGNHAPMETCTKCHKNFYK